MIAVKETKILFHHSERNMCAADSGGAFVRLLDGLFREGCAYVVHVANGTRLQVYP